MAQRGVCPYCGRWLTYRDGRNWHESLEHVFPSSRGFTLVANALLTHKLCNERKGDRTPTGCELLWLYSVNTRLGIAGGPGKVEDGSGDRDSLDG